MASQSQEDSEVSDHMLMLSDLLQSPSPAQPIYSPSLFLDLPETPISDELEPIPSHIDSPEDMILPYISKILMEEDIDDKFIYQYPDQVAAAEAPFAEILATNSDSPNTTTTSPNSNSYSYSYSDDTTTDQFGGFNDQSEQIVEPAGPATWAYDPLELMQLQTHPYAVQEQQQQLEISGISGVTSIEQNNRSYINNDNSSFVSGARWENAELSLAFLKGMEEAKKFLPSNFIDLEAATTAAGFPMYTPSSEFTQKKEAQVAAAAQAQAVVVKKEEEEEEEDTFGNNISSRGRKNPYPDGETELDVEEGRSNKQSAVSTEDSVREMFDQVLLGGQDMCLKGFEELREAMKNEAAKNSQANGKGGRGRRQSRDVVDLRTLLIHCAQAVANDDRRSANELLKQIRQHSLPTGDATQRLAHCFADGLQARLAGTGSQVFHALMAKRTSAVDILKAYQLYLFASPFKKMSFFFSNHTILKAAQGVTKLHIVDYGIHYGFQWPCLLSRLANRDGGPPRLKITGIDLPQPGFRPAERIEETGRRLASYAKDFGVQFEYRAIAAKWETIRVEDIDIDPDELLIVNALYQFRNLADESVVPDSPRDIVLNTISKMKPYAFIHGIVNGSYSAPFFVTRFREALFHYSAMYDMLEATTPRESDQRMLIERELFGRSALNVISCEGSERVERPETYKQWQVRNRRAGLKQHPLDMELLEKVKEKVRLCYHKDFVVDVDHQWLLQGWKGRIVYAISTWFSEDA